jgi:hypothetical protein
MDVDEIESRTTTPRRIRCPFCSFPQGYILRSSVSSHPSFFPVGKKGKDDPLPPSNQVSYPPLPDLLAEPV